MNTKRISLGILTWFLGIIVPVLHHTFLHGEISAWDQMNCSLKENNITPNEGFDALYDSLRDKAVSFDSDNAKRGTTKRVVKNTNVKISIPKGRYKPGFRSAWLKLAKDRWLPREQYRNMSEDKRLKYNEETRKRRQQLKTEYSVQHTTTSSKDNTDNNIRSGGGNDSTTQTNGSGRDGEITVSRTTLQRILHHIESNGGQNGGSDGSASEIAPAVGASQSDVAGSFNPTNIGPQSRYGTYDYTYE